MPLLSVDKVKRRFGGILALDDVSLELEEGAVAGLIGPNGAGKTTLFNVITRLYTPDGGAVAFDGRDLLKMPAYRIVGAGIARTFQNVALFHMMSVLDNVLLGAHSRLGWRAEKQARADALAALAYLGLADLAARPVAGLPFGTLKRVEIARALVSKPRLLLLDEPAGGLNHEEVGELAQLIGRLRTDYALTILLVEHHMNLVMAVSERVYVLNFGRMIAQGEPAEVQADPQVIEAYLGAPEDEHPTRPGRPAPTDSTPPPADSTPPPPDSRPPPNDLEQEGDGAPA